MNFEFDPDKSQENRIKHGIAFGSSVVVGRVRRRRPCMTRSRKQPKTVEEFDRYFETHDIADLLDTETRRVNIDFPAAVLSRLDLKAKQLGLTRQALVKYWIAERLNLLNNSSD
jgi:hypothetical protein